jgi:hypothetical protein
MTTHEGTFPGERVHESGRMEDAGKRLGRKVDDAVAARVETARERVHGLEAAGARLQHGIQVTGERVKHRVRDGRRRVSHEVQEHPLRTLVYAFGAGAVIGLIMAKRNRGKRH